MLLKQILEFLEYINEAYKRENKFESIFINAHTSFWDQLCLYCSLHHL